MASLNKVMIIGNLGLPPEMRFAGDNEPVTNLKVAVNTKVRDSEITEWFKVVVWGKDAENCNKYLNKGDAVFVEGRLQTRSYDKDGTQVYVTELISQRIQFLGKMIKEEEAK
jgi:single-strand DNA-binding protein